MASSSSCLLLHDPSYPSPSSISTSQSQSHQQQQQDQLFLFYLLNQQHCQDLDTLKMPRKRPIFEISSSDPLTLPPHPPPPPPPAIYNFSGLPLFTPSSDPVIDTPAPSSAASSLEAPDSSSAATAWVDGIIRDLISSASPEVSIPQLIENVRQIILPCNPSLASVLESRLRLLISVTYLKIL